MESRPEVVCPIESRLEVVCPMESSLHLTHSWSSVTVLKVKLNFICTCVIDKEPRHLEKISAVKRSVHIVPP